MPKRFALALIGLAFWMGAACLPASAQEAAAPPARLELSGLGLVPTAVTRESLARLPAVEMDVAFQTSKGESKGRYKGVLLWTVLEQAGLSKGSDMHARLRNTFVVTGRDGYAVAFSVGEIAPDFGDRPVMLATERDGKALPPEDGLRLIVPGDKRGARNVRDVVRIDLR